MAAINAKDVMKLRNTTGLAMMECKKALTEAEGDFEKAENLLRLKLKGKMDSRTERVAGEGAIVIATKGDSVVMVEVRAETDFTAKNDRFAAAVQQIAEIALEGPDGCIEPTEAMTALIDDVRISTGENCSIARVCKLTNAGGSFGSYIHHDGKTAALVEVEGEASVETLRDVCMHIAAGVPTVPLGISPDDVPKEAAEKEKAFRIQQAVESGKPKEIAEKIVEGGMRKYYEEVALSLQPFVKDPSKTIAEVVGSGVTIKAFHRWMVGEETKACECCKG
ncbi:Translation elongation factor Ts [hydrothermal vent metagenome]|uniref:Translation elongation factor Ts n=1 Tax=hydrothermal vent metagenome TaxID=652676 RepID=A0A3B1DUK1_9ZZZZ